ncbi:MAG: CRISPR-associated endonuclease Cas2 [Spirochaetales bacterium]|nr:CRISPR-associated endonuclease Cas2 [Spirochaetales bacterium]
MNMIIAYDIRHPKRLRRIAKICEKNGRRLQKSIFEAMVTKESFPFLKARLERIMAPNDSICYLELCAADQNEIEVYGKAEKERLKIKKFVII